MSLDNIERQPVDCLIQAVLRGNQRALASAITLIERQNAAADILLRRFITHASAAPIIGITGAPGVGKSTLVNRLITSLRAEGKTVAVAAVDPASPASGGAVLGDRLRMNSHSADPSVFIRSISSRGSVGGLSQSVFAVTTAMLAAGWDVVIVETVGAGQAEIEIIKLADITVVVTAPGLGDEVQAIKAGILEIADVLVVNKSDTPGAEVAAQQLVNGSGLRLRIPEVPVICTSASTGRGVDQLVAAVYRSIEERASDYSASRGRLRIQNLLVKMCGRELERQLNRSQSILMAIADEVVDGRLDLHCAVDNLLGSLLARYLPDPVEANAYSCC